ncbi:MAG: hypothetical protein WBX15_08115 [Thermoanaerobaculia bacterium]
MAVLLVAGGLLFALIGAAALLSAIRSLTTVRSDAAGSYPARIRARGSRPAAVLWLLAAVWWGVAIPGAIPWLRGHGQGVLGVVALVILGFFGAALVILASETTVRNLRFGKSVLTLRKAPRVGMQLDGLVTLPRRAVSGEVRAELRCRRKLPEGSDGADEILWTSSDGTRMDEGGADGRNLRIPVMVEIPAGLPGSGDAVHWILRVSGSRQGTGYRAIFDVEVNPERRSAGLSGAELESGEGE